MPLPLKRSHRFALLGVGLVALWVASGVFSGGDEAHEAETAAAPRPLPKIEAEDRAATEHPVQVKAYGVTEAARKVDLIAETDGLVAAVKAEEGARVNEGDVIVVLDTRDKLERLRQAKAALRAKEKVVNASKRLNIPGYRSEIAVAQDQADLEAARAQVRAMEIDLERTQVKAPFSGLLDAIVVKRGDFVGFRMGDAAPAGSGGGASPFGSQAVATLVDDSSMLAVAQLSEFEHQGVKVGAPARVRLSTGEALEGTVSLISAVASPGTRTYRVEVAIPNPERAIAHGMGVEIVIDKEKVDAYRVPQALLSLDDAGVVGLKVLEGRTVAFLPVTLLADTAEGVWVAGLPERIRLITQGQALVAPGEELSEDRILMKDGSGEAPH